MPNKKPTKSLSKKPKTAGVKKKRTKTRSKSGKTVQQALMRSVIGFALLLALVLAAGIILHFSILKKTLQKSETIPRHPEKVTGMADKPFPLKPSKPIVYTPMPRFEIFPEKELKPPPKKQKPDAELKKPRVAIIIDDLGYDSVMAEKFLALDRNLTFSVLPYSPYIEDISNSAGINGQEMLLHLPMEPVEYPAVDPGPGALLTSMSPDELIRQLEFNLQEFPIAVGVNNHMGSKLTQDDAKMHQVFTILKKKKLFFVDSHTTALSVCRPAAGLLKVPFAQRDVFIDHKLDENSIRKQLKRLVAVSRMQGEAVGIAHPHEITFKTLKQQLPLLKKEVYLIPVSQLVRIPG
jgi:polysaccharide deacetylase 2 family uncharacterized protein YibQ